MKTLLCKRKEKSRSISPTYVRLESKEVEIRKGYVPVLVGNSKDDEAMERLLIPVKLINHPSLAFLLDVSVQEHGYNQEGLLRISCEVERFKEMLKTISRSK